MSIGYSCNHRQSDGHGAGSRTRGEARGWGVCHRAFVCMVSDASGGHRLIRVAGLRIDIQLFALR
eukprot:6306570-Prymnesium_polylepis.1